MDVDLRKLRVPTFCPVCRGMMVGKSTSTYYDFGCCVNCFIFFIEGRKERWLGGWRPTPEMIESMDKSLGR